VMELTGLPDISAPLPWHAQEWQRFNQQIQEQKLPHAMLLAGVAHTGATRLALALSRLLLCHQPSGGLNCGQCQACKLSASGSHGDFIWLQPEEGSRVIKIDQVRAAVALAQQTAGFGERKVIAFAPADALNISAANALLKSLEEPSAGTHLILVSNQLHSIVPTIRSRCQIVKLPTPTPAECLPWLDSLTGDRAQSQGLLELCDGLPLLAESMYRDQDSEQVHAVRLACRGLFSGKASPEDVVGVLSQAETEEVLDQFYLSAQARARSLPRVELASPVGRGIFALMDEVGDIRRAVGGGANPNKQLLAEVLVGKAQHVLG
jgi:DNA polymerase III subunit delta'